MPGLGGSPERIGSPMYMSDSGSQESPLSKPSNEESGRRDSWKEDGARESLEMEKQSKRDADVKRVYINQARKELAVQSELARAEARRRRLEEDRQRKEKGEIIAGNFQRRWRGASVRKFYEARLNERMKARHSVSECTRRVLSCIDLYEARVKEGPPTDAWKPWEEILDQSSKHMVPEQNEDVSLIGEFSCFLITVEIYCSS